MAVTVGSELDSDGQPTALIIRYAAGYHVSGAEAEWLRGLISEAAADATELQALREHVASVIHELGEEG